MPSAAAQPSLEERVAAQSEQSIRQLVTQLRSPLGVIPFVGAGFSVPFGFPEWGQLLIGLAGVLDREARERVRVAVDAEEYVRAAAIVERALGEYDFQSQLAESFPDEALARADRATLDVGFVPLLASGLVITTNFDGVLEHVFERAGRSFEDTVHGANATQIVPAIQQNRLVLWKLHGDRKDPRTRVLSVDDYETHYAHLHDLLALALANRPALFLGSSLVNDRTVGVLADTKERWPGVRHFAVLPYPADEEKFDARIAELLRLGVRPIWYREGRHEEIRSHLSVITQLAAGVRLELEAPTAGPSIEAGDVGKARSSLDVGLSILAGTMMDPPPEAGPPYPELLDRASRGELAFFLGAAATLGKLPLAVEFYDRLRTFVEGAGDLNDQRVTQHYADRFGRKGLDAKVQEMLGKPSDPTAVHLLLATLRLRLQEKGRRPRPPLILTTNFDDWMERALLAAGEPYHLFTFRVEEPYEGYFVYRSPAGELTVVDRPTQFHELADDSAIVVKYHGGLHRDVPLPVTYAFTRGDFMQTTRRLPEAVPRVIRDRLAESSLLYLGHGLADDSVEALAREHHRRRSRDARAWAIQRKPPPGWPLYWHQIGVEIVDVGLQRFVVELNERLNELPAS